MQDCTTSTSQQWTFDSSNRIINIGYNQCVEAQSGIADLSILVLNTCGTSFNQKFDVFTLGVIVPDTNYYNGSLKLKNYNDILTFKAKRNINDINDSPVELVYSSTLDLYKQCGYDITTKQIKGTNGKCLSAASTVLKLSECTGNDNQKWQTDELGRLYNFSNKYQCIVSYYGSVEGAYGTYLILSTCNSNQTVYINNLDIPAGTNVATPQLNLKVNLSGPWNTTTKLMNQYLKTNNKIPLS